MRTNIFRFITLLAVAMLVTSCSSTSYLTQSYNEKDFSGKNPKGEVSSMRIALERPQIKYTNVDSINHAKAIEELSENTYVSYFDLTIGQILKAADSYMGTPYRFGGTTRRGIDCSAFMQRIFEKEGIKLPRVSINQSKIGSPVPRNMLQKGDLVFFSTTSRTRVTHVGMVYDVKDNGEVYFIHASSSRGVTVSRLGQSYWSKRYRKARRISEFVTPQFVRSSSGKNNES